MNEDQKYFYESIRASAQRIINAANAAIKDDSDHPAELASTDSLIESEVDNILFIMEESRAMETE